jgi:hypothetical protein
MAREASQGARYGAAAAARGLALAFAFAVASSPMTACVGSAPDRPAHGAEPPAPLPEIISGPPAPGMVWVPGAWHWDGARYVWLPGRWESPPPAPG